MCAGRRVLPPSCRNLGADTKGGGIKAANELWGRGPTTTHTRVALLAAALLIGPGTAVLAQMIVGPAVGPGPPPSAPPPGSSGMIVGPAAPGSAMRPPPSMGPGPSEIGR